MDRRKYIGGADAASILGLNDFQSVQKCWRKKVGLETDDVDNRHIRRGNRMESVIEQYCIDELDGDINSVQMFERYGTPQAVANLASYNEAMNGPAHAMVGVQRPQITVLHPDLPYCGGHPDGLTDKYVWEFKAPAMRNFKYIESYGVSLSWVIQVQYYMWITKIPEARICVWNYDEWEPMIVRIKPDRRLFKSFDELMPAFWFHVETQTEPDFEGLQDVGHITENDLLDLILDDYCLQKETKFEAETQVKLLKATIETHLPGFGDFETDNFTIRNKEQQRFGTKFATLTIRHKETVEAKSWLKTLREEQAIEKINDLIKEHDLKTFSQ